MSTENTIRTLICQVNVTLRPESLSVTDDITESGMLDSYGFVELMALLESHFNITIDDSEITGDHFATIEKVARFVDSKNSSPAAMVN
jgi:acyl carrier protein